MECTVSWTGASGTRSGMGFVAETGSGHIVNMDGAPDAAKPENGGQNLAPRPMELLLAGTGGCTAYDVVLILQRGRHAVEGCSVKLTSERADTEPKVFTRIHMHFTVKGRNLPASAVERAIAMSHDKYCSASIMLAKTAEITTSFEVIEVGAVASRLPSGSRRWVIRARLMPPNASKSQGAKLEAMLGQKSAAPLTVCSVA